MNDERLNLLSRVEKNMHNACSNAHLLLGGKPISDINREILSRCMSCWLVLMEDLMIRLDIPLGSRVHRMWNFSSAFRVLDVSYVISLFGDLYAFFISEESTAQQFKAVCCNETSSLVDGKLFSPINKAIYLCFDKTDPKEKAFFLAIIAQFLRFPRKLCFQDIGLESIALEKYYETELELATMEDIPEHLTIDLDEIIQVWFRDFKIESLKPSHGPGSVAEGPLTLFEKFQGLGCDGVMKVLLRNPSFPDSYKEYYPLQPLDTIVRESRTIFVPKTASKLRTISMEPVSLQYIQQGVMKELYKYIGNHPYLGCVVRLDDQSHNQYLALEGSINGKFATIDLSHASDSVSWNLVRKVFKHSPALYKWLIGTRSTRSRMPDGSTCHLQKFAPMGSALCFPIECIIFAAMVEYSIRKVRTAGIECSTLYSVFGDDLVVPTACVEELLITLRHMQ